MKVSPSAVSYALLFLMLCSIERDNPLDSKGSRFVPPEIVVQESLSTIPRNDTIHVATGSISVKGNRTESRFQITLDDTRSNEWDAEGIFSFDSLDDGRHVLHIASRYEKGSSTVTDSVVFYVKTAGYRPSFARTKDTTIAVDSGAELALIPGALGADTLTLKWLKNDSVIAGADSGTLVFPSVVAADAGTYYCKATNSYGFATSTLFTVTVHAPLPILRRKIFYYGNDSDSGKVPVDENRYAQKEQVTLAANTGTLYKKGYTFAGWSFSAADTINVHAAGSAITMDTSDILVYAVWTKQPMYRLVYDRNGAMSGKAPLEGNTYLKGSSVPVLDNTGGLEMPDSIFAGWSRSPGDTTKIYHYGDTLVIGTADTLFASWKAKSRYYLTYNGNGAGSGNVPEDKTGYISGSSAAVKGNPGALDKTGYSFVGWSSDKDGKANRYSGGDTIIFGTSSIELFAVWSSNPTFTVTYNKNGAETGEVPVDSNHYETGFPITIKENSGNLKKAGFTFIGWNRLDDGTGTLYKPGNQLDMTNKNLILYAIWTNNPTFTITYLPNGATAGDVPRDVTNYETGSKITVAGKGTLTKTGWSFTGWNTESDGSGTQYLKDSTFTMGTGSDTLYALWRINTFTIRFDAQGGDSVASQTISYGGTVTVPNPAPKQATYDFSGWYTEKACINRWDFATVVTTNDTLFAKWVRKTYVVSFTTLGGTAVASQTVTYGGTATLPTPEPKRTNYAFAGWYGDTTSSTVWNFATTITGPVTLFAKWTLNRYTVTFLSLGGDSVSPQTVVHGGKVTAPANPARANYDFSDWYREPGLTNKWNFTTDTVTSAVTLYAKWIIHHYTVTFDARGGSTVSSQLVNHGDTVVLPATPTKFCYALAGWYADSNFTTAWQFGTNKVTTAITLYARWVSSFVPPETQDLTTVNTKLPDPFTFYDGTKLTRKDQWACRRAEILAMAQKYVYGPMPPDSGEITGTVTSSSITATVKVGSKSVDLTFNTSGTGDILSLVVTAGISPSGCRTLSLSPNSTWSSAITNLYGIANPCGTIQCAWAAKVICTVVNKNPTAGIDPKKIMVTGCSGAGKVAMTTGAFCEGISLTVIVESGGGGAASFRMCEWFRHGAGSTVWNCPDGKPQGIDNLESNGVAGPWINSSVASWLITTPSKVNNLPYDQHLVEACIAPRACCHVTNQNGINEWCNLGGTCEALSAWAAEPVWNALGVPNNFGFLMYTEASPPGHCSNPASAKNLADEFFKRFFNGDTSAKTDTMSMNASDLQQPQADWRAMWVDWNMETNLQ